MFKLLINNIFTKRNFNSFKGSSWESHKWTLTIKVFVDEKYFKQTFQEDFQISKLKFNHSALNELSLR